MKSAALTYGSGPGSAIALSPTSIRVRDAIIEKFIDKSLDELNSFLASALDTETDESKRIGILAARVYILRTRISKIIEFNENPLMSRVEAVSPHELVNSLEEEPDKPHIDEGDEEDMGLQEWNELTTIEDGEVNGVRIPSGVAITVGREDAARLIETGKAVRVTETGPAPEDEQQIEPDIQPEADEPQVNLADSEAGDDGETQSGNMVEDAGMPAEPAPTDQMPTDDSETDNVPADDSADADDTADPETTAAGEGETNENQT